MLAVPMASVEKVMEDPSQRLLGFTGCCVMLKTITVNDELLVPVPLAVVTVTTPDVAPIGTVVVMLVDELAITVAAVPLNFTVLFAGVALKFVPVIVTVAPTSPCAGENEVIAGAFVIVKGLTVMMVLHPT
jgi:hypothetical protein